MLWVLVSPPVHIGSELPKVLFKVLFWALLLANALFWALKIALFKGKSTFLELLAAQVISPTRSIPRQLTLVHPSIKPTPTYPRPLP